MRRKSFCYFVFIIIISAILSGCNNSSNNVENANTDYENIEISRTGTISNEELLNTLTSESNNTVNNVTSDTNNTVNNSTNTSLSNTTNETTTSDKTSQETVLSEFSTQILSSSSNRLNNIQITCNKLNGTIVESGEEFSFCQTVGKATEAAGYKKADVIVNKQVVQALGGGNCQVSSTLYNAVLTVNNLTVTERHPHGKKVNYVAEGKDAAIAYGSKDFKFINNAKNSVKIYAQVSNSCVYIKIVSV